MASFKTRVSEGSVVCLADIFSSQVTEEWKEEKKAGEYLLFPVSLSEFHTLDVLEVKWWSEKNLSRASVLQQGNVSGCQCSIKKTKSPEILANKEHRNQQTYFISLVSP